MRRLLAAGVTVAVLTSCGLTKNGNPPALLPMPSNVPTTPDYATADSIVEALGKAGLPCKILRRAETDPGFGTGLDCQAEIQGTKFENEINVSNPQRSDYRKQNGDSIGLRRKPPTSHTLVAAGNWFIWVRNPRFAPQVAKALSGVVLPPDEVKIPKYPLPDIPGAPRYRTVNALADALDTAVGCTNRSAGGSGTLTCTTGKRTGHSPNCATLALYTTDTDRDTDLRSTIAYQGVPATLVAAGNWTVNLCDSSLGTQVAEALHGRVISYDGT